MAGKQVQRRRGTTAETAVFTGANGECTVDTTKKVVVVHDGVTAGGFPQARKSDVDTVATAAATADAKAVAAQTSANTGIANAATAQTQANLGVSKANTAQAEVDALETVVAANAATAVQKDSNVGAAHMPIGNTAQRPVAPQEGDFRYNSQLSRFEGYQTGQWAQVGGDSLPLFYTTWWPTRTNIPAGFIVADGQTLPRATYPDAAAGVIAGNVPTATDANWLALPAQRGKYTLGDGSTTIRMPDYNGKSAGSLGAPFLRGDGAGSAGTAGLIRQDQFQGHVMSAPPGANFITTLSGPAYGSAATGSNYQGATGGPISDGTNGTPRFGTETRPIDLCGCWVVKLFGAVINPGSVNAAQLASDMANLQAIAYTKANIVGGVSQSGGVPTGAVIETGSNANGEWTKWADGTMICSGFKAPAASGGFSSFGGIFYLGPYAAYTFPQAFVGSPPKVKYGCVSANGSTWAADGGAVSGLTTTATYIVFNASAATTTITPFYTAHGRWF